MCGEGFLNKRLDTERLGKSRRVEKAERKEYGFHDA
jgi:hypothetical protein